MQKDYFPEIQIPKPIYPLSIGDIWQAVGIISQFDALAQQHVDFCAAEPGDTDPEALADQVYYDAINRAHLWAFCIWRIHGILEAMIDQRLGGTASKLRGIKSKLLWLISQEVPIDHAHIEALQRWTEVRNRLTHFPTWSFQPAWISEAEARVFGELAEEILAACGYERPLTPY